MRTATFKLDELKMTDGEAGHFTGRASVYGIKDLQGDVIMPGAFTKSLARTGNLTKVLNQHNAFDVIGKARLEDTPEALLVADAALSLDLFSATEAHVRLKEGLIDGISIGYQTVTDRVEDDTRFLMEVDLWEVSLVTFPANPMARVTGVKALEDFNMVELEELLGRCSVEQKAGAVLNKRNLGKLKQLIALATDILTSAEAEDADKAAAQELEETTEIAQALLGTLRQARA